MERGRGGQVLPAPSMKPLPPSGLTSAGQYTATKVAASRKTLIKKTRTREGGGAPVPCFLLYHHQTLGLRVDKMLSCSSAHNTKKTHATSCSTKDTITIAAR